MGNPPHYQEKQKGSLVKFHSQHKYLFMAYHPGQLNTLGKIVANHQQDNIQTVFANYEVFLMHWNRRYLCLIHLKW